MSDVLECGRVLEMLPRWADGELAAEEISWLNGHVAGCAGCAAALAEFAAIDAQLAGWGQRMARQNPPLRDARERLAARLMPIPARLATIRWMPAAAAALAAAVVLAAIMPRGPLPR
jgi:anti-sigma factor RsiW